MTDRTAVFIAKIVLFIVIIAVVKLVCGILKTDSNVVLIYINLWLLLSVSGNLVLKNKGDKNG